MLFCTACRRVLQSDRFADDQRNDDLNANRRCQTCHGNDIPSTPLYDETKSVINGYVNEVQLYQIIDTLIEVHTPRMNVRRGVITQKVKDILFQEGPNQWRLENVRTVMGLDDWEYSCGSVNMRYSGGDALPKLILKILINIPNDFLIRYTTLESENHSHLLMVLEEVVASFEQKTRGYN